MLNKTHFILILCAVLIGVAPLTACAPAGSANRPYVSNTGHSLSQKTVRATTKKAARKHVTRVPNPDLLLGLSTSEVEKLLGNADLRRREPPAEVWQYESMKCVLHLFLYESGGDFRVEHYEASGQDGQPETGGICLANLIDG